MKQRQTKELLQESTRGPHLYNERDPTVFSVSIDKWMDGWMDGWMEDGQMDGCMDGWMYMCMDRWMDR